MRDHCCSIRGAAAKAPAEMSEETASGVPLVGSRISLISKKSIRYEGILYNINTTDASLALQNGESRFRSWD